MNTMSTTTPEAAALAEDVKKGELYLCNAPELPLGSGKRVYIRDDNATSGGPDYPIEGIVFDVEGFGDRIVNYTQRGVPASDPRLRNSTLKEKDTYCANFAA